MVVIYMRILVIEDEVKIADVIANALESEKFLVDVCNDGESGLDNALYGLYDLIILDVMLPSVDGFTILREVRKVNSEVKIIMLTARTVMDDKLAGLRSGANDYITKPFHMDELIARVNVQLRKNFKEDNNVIEVFDLKLDLKKSLLTCTSSNESIEVVGKELLILEYLMNNSNQVISKDMIYDKIWGMDNEVESNNVEVYLSFIRKKIRIIDSKVNIRAIRGLGYKLEVCDEKIKK